MTVVSVLMTRGAQALKNKAASKLTALAREEGFEPPTSRFEAWYSIQLSYTRLVAIRWEPARDGNAVCCPAGICCPGFRRSGSPPDRIPSSAAAGAPTRTSRRGCRRSRWAAAYPPAAARPLVHRRERDVVAPGKCPRAKTSEGARPRCTGSPPRVAPAPSSSRVTCSRLW